MQAALQQLAHKHPHMPCRLFLPNWHAAERITQMGALKLALPGRHLSIQLLDHLRRHAAERITQMGALEFVRTVAYW